MWSLLRQCVTALILLRQNVATPNLVSSCGSYIATYGYIKTALTKIPESHGFSTFTGFCFPKWQ